MTPQTRRLTGILVALVGSHVLLGAMLLYLATTSFHGLYPFVRALLFVFTFGGLALPEASGNNANEIALSAVLAVASIVLMAIGMFLYLSGRSRSAANEGTLGPSTTVAGVAAVQSSEASALLFWKHSWKKNLLLAGIAVLLPFGLALPVALITAFAPGLEKPLSALLQVLLVIALVYVLLCLSTAVIKLCYALIRCIANIIRG